MNVELPLIVSFSGGKTSAFMSLFLKKYYENSNRKLIFIFANTGKEREETLQFVNKCSIEFGLNVVWLEYDIIENKSTFKITNYDICSRMGEPFEKMISKYGLPNVMNPHCSRELKLQTITRYLRSIGLKKGQYITAIGIRADESNRINHAKAVKENYIYPLADLNITKSFIENYWAKQSFNLKLNEHEGNCDFCFKKSFRKLLTLAKAYPEKIEWWSNMEKKYGNGYTFFRNNKNAQEILKESFNFNDLVKDKNYIDIGMFEPSLDVEFECICSNL